MPDWPINISYREMVHSDYAETHDIDNECPENLKEELKKTAFKVQQARDILSFHYGRPVPIKITSGYRSPYLNIALTKGATSTGVHPVARAVDIVPMGVNTKEAYDILADDVTFMADVDQLIYESHQGVCIHIGRPYGHGPRHELKHDAINSEGRRCYILDRVVQC